jgi:hypothetical protein
MPKTAVVLIPGFFGYSAFGPDNRPILEYFGGVRAVLQRRLPDHFIVAHEPPPTGTLESRVKSLDDAVGKLLRGEQLPHGREAFQAERVHLVGHSTGGVDARLFANPAYTWKGAPSRDERIEAVGDIVTVSAPFHGTPLATNIEGENALLLEGIRVLTMLGVFSDGDLVKVGLEIAKLSPLAIPKAIASALAPQHFLRSFASLFVGKDHALHEDTKSLFAAIARKKEPQTDSELVATQVGKFFGQIEKHHELLGDLRVDSMAKTTERLAPSDHGRIHSYVTVAPSPPAVPLLDLDAIRHLELVQAIIYATLYKDTKEPPAVKASVPEGPEVGDGAPLELVGGASASDGVVPTRSQTIKGTAAGVVLGDHLDVVGSFDGGSGANVMRSGARFKKDRFEKLWTEIAGKLA